VGAAFRRPESAAWLCKKRDLGLPWTLQILHARDPRHRVLPPFTDDVTVVVAGTVLAMPLTMQKRSIGERVDTLEHGMAALVSLPGEVGILRSEFHASRVEMREFHDEMRQFQDVVASNFTRLENKVDEGFRRVDERINAVDERFNAVDEGLKAVIARIDALGDSRK
jgi:hypothetical protein